MNYIFYAKLQGQMEQQPFIARVPTSAKQQQQKLEFEDCFTIFLSSNADICRTILYAL
jgi:hypothetical protein